MLGNPLLLGDDGYQISRSVRLRSSASAYFNRTPAGNGNAQKFTISFWVKIGTLGATYANLFGAGAISSGGGDPIYLNGNNLTLFADGGAGANLTTSQVFRDPSAWYHVFYAVDTTQATASNRIKLYVNGVQVTAFSTATYPTQNYNFLSLNKSSVVQYLGFGYTNYFDGYLTEVNFIDGQALTPSSFGETDSITGVWKPKKYAGTYGTNGFYLNFSDPSAATAAAIGKDSSGNGNNWTPNNISVTAGVTYDSMLDVPTMWADGGNGRGNYAVLNPLSNDQYSTLTDGNLALLTSVTLCGGLNASIGVSSGKWYWETTVGATGAPAQSILGIRNQSSVITGSNGYPGGDANGYGYYGSGGNKYNAGTGSAYGSSYTSGDVIGVAFDADAGTLTFYKNNTSQGVAFSSIPMTNNVWFPAFGDGATGSQCLLTVNFGQRPFTYTPPTGFKALNTQNLPDATIKAGNKYFDVSLYTGNGTSQSIVNSGGFQPDLVWVKERSGTRDHRLVDSVRGVGKELYSDLTFAEAIDAVGLTSFNSNGYSIGSSVGYNASGVTQVGWQWKKGASQGFDIVTYTGTGVARTVAHSLGVAPSMMIIKNRTSAVDWLVYHTSLGNTNYAVLDTTAAAATSAAAWNNTSPTSSVFTVGTGTSVNQNTNNHVAYLFAEVAGFSRFGSYTGNGSADGPFVYCGFRPRFLLIKRTSSNVSGGNWIMKDTSRDPYNASQNNVYSNLSNAEGAAYPTDFTSNGFKIRETDVDINQSGGTYIYAAFAENPFKNSLAR